jgi:hypothetical protein
MTELVLSLPPGNVANLAAYLSGQVGTEIHPWEAGDLAVHPDLPRVIAGECQLERFFEVGRPGSILMVLPPGQPPSGEVFI